MRHGQANEAWVAGARAVPIEEAALERGATLRRLGRELVGPCPACGGRDRFAINLAKGLFLCREALRAGDPNATGDVITLVQYLDGVGFLEACERLTGRPAPSGHRDAGSADDPDEAARRRARAAVRRDERARAAEARRVERGQLALRLWGEAAPIAGTLAEAYLRGRGIALPLPPTLRFHSSARHGLTGTAWPALVAAVQDGDGFIVAVHRTYLDPAGGKAPVEPPRLMLGEPRDGVVRLGPAGRRLGLAEGIETGLSAQRLTGLSVWCALGDRRFDRIALPARVQHLVVFSDAGSAGQAAADRALAAHARPGRRVRSVVPTCGSDFNDVLLEQITDAAA